MPDHRIDRRLALGELHPAFHRLFHLRHDRFPLFCQGVQFSEIARFSHLRIQTGNFRFQRFYTFFHAGKFLFFLAAHLRECLTAHRRPGDR